jgi:hypothetical protein
MFVNRIKICPDLHKLRWSARTLCLYAHADLAQKYSVGLKEIFVSRLCYQEENYFLPGM